MNDILLKIKDFMTSDTYQLIFMGLIAIIVAFGIVCFVQVVKDEKYEAEAFSRTYKKSKKKNILTDVILKTLKENVIALTVEKGKPIEKAHVLMNILIGLVVVLGIFMFFVKQYVFAIVLPIILLYVMTKITGIIRKTFGDYVLLQLPGAIECLIRVFSGYNDLKTVLYESSKTLPEPMRGVFQDLARRMTNEAPEIVLQEFMDNSKNIWVYSMTFNLLSYVEDAKKEDVLENLRELKEVIDRDNREKKKQKIERKLTTSINYVLCLFAFAGFVGNLIFNKNIAIPFFFGSIGGIACFLGGMSLLVVSVFSNLLIGSGKE